VPIYEYQCGTCGHQLEAMQKFSDAPLTQCPECGKDTLKKLVSATSFQLKGTGWYATDIRDKGKPKPAESEKTTGEKAAGAATETKTETKSSTGTDRSSE
jgi:putative FmdB family regulatory protein